MLFTREKDDLLALSEVEVFRGSYRANYSRRAWKLLFDRWKIPG
jgi:hypothetical protein